MERVKGIEPSLPAWEAEVLPLNYTRSPQSVIIAPFAPQNQISKTNQAKFQNQTPSRQNPMPSQQAPMPPQPRCVVNGRRRPAGGTVAALVCELGLAGKKIAVEKNGEIVPKSRHESEPVAAGDILEIVAAVGGG